MQAIYWLIIFVVLLVIEFATMGLTTIWFAIGALGAIAVALIGGDLIIQLLVFFVLSVEPVSTMIISSNRSKQEERQFPKVSSSFFTIIHTDNVMIVYMNFFYFLTNKHYLKY